MLNYTISFAYYRNPKYSNIRLFRLATLFEKITFTLLPWAPIKAC